MAQTNPRPPAKPSFGLSICPAAAVGAGLASASVPEGSGEAGEPADGVSPVACALLPLHLCAAPAECKAPEAVRSCWDPHLSFAGVWGGGLGLLWLTHTVPSHASDEVRLTYWESAQLQTGTLLLERRCRWLFLLHLPAPLGGKWVLLQW